VLIEIKAEVEDPTQTRTQRPPRRRWHAITIVGRATACAAAQACKGKRFLSSEAPRLPLSGCDVQQCGCKYRHFEDRRGEPRRTDEKIADSKRPSTNRRATRGRRATD
jgi:hypothetical protein